MSAPIVTPILVRDAEALAREAVENGPPFRGHIIERVTALVMRVDQAAREQSGAKDLLAALQRFIDLSDAEYLGNDPRAHHAVKVARAAIRAADPESEPIENVVARVKADLDESFVNSPTNGYRVRQ